MAEYGPFADEFTTAIWQHSELGCGNRHSHSSPHSTGVDPVAKYLGMFASLLTAHRAGSIQYRLHRRIGVNRGRAGAIYPPQKLFGLLRQRMVVSFVSSPSTPSHSIDTGSTEQDRGADPVGPTS